MDTRTGKLYESCEAARAAGVPDEHIAIIRAASLAEAEAALRAADVEALKVQEHREPWRRRGRP